MRRLVGIVAAAVLAGCTSGTIQGDVVVGPGFGGRSVAVLLWQEQVSDDGSGPQYVQIDSQLAGFTAAAGGRYLYRFVALQKGTYVVGAFLDAQGDGSAECDLRSWDLAAPLEVDPEDKAKATATHDVWLGANSPGRIGVRGTVHMSGAARATTVRLLALDKPINDATAQLLADQEVCGSTTDEPFALYNLPPEARLVAIADVGSDDGSADPCAEGIDNDFFAFGPAPLTPDTGTDTATGVELWLDRDSPAGGALQGTVQLSAPLPTARVQMVAFTADPRRDASAAMTGIVNVSPGTSLSAPFSLTGLPLGHLFLAAFPFTREGNCRVLQRNGTLQSFDLTAETPAQRGIVVPVGVGRVSGRVELANAPAGLRRVFVFASALDTAGSARDQYDVFEGRVADGAFALDYELWGLDDGAFNMTLVPDMDGDGDYQGDADGGHQYAGTPSQIRITGGDRQGCDFRRTLP